MHRLMSWGLAIGALPSRERKESVSINEFLCLMRDLKMWVIFEEPERLFVQS